jgi:hypothetical protein
LLVTIKIWLQIIGTPKWGWFTISPDEIWPTAMEMGRQIDS